MAENLTRRRFLGRSAGIVAAAGSMGLISAARSEDAPKTSSGGKLKKAVLFAMLPKALPVADRFKLAADVGFEGVEGETTASEKEVDELHAAAEKAGIRIHSVMHMGHWENPLSSPEPEVIKASVEAVKVSIKNAKSWGAETVLLVPGVVGKRGKQTTLVRYKDAYERSQKVIREQILPAAGEAGVTIACENVWNKFLLSPLEFARYVDEFKDPHLGAYFDIGNNVQYGYPEDWILTLGPRIRKFHLKDFKRSDNQFVMLREGDVDWPAVRKAIDEIGYSGFLTAEYGAGDEAYLRDIAKRIDLIFAGK